MTLDLIRHVLNVRTGDILLFPLPFRMPFRPGHAALVTHAPYQVHAKDQILLTLAGESLATFKTVERQAFWEDGLSFETFEGVRKPVRIMLRSPIETRAVLDLRTDVYHFEFIAGRKREVKVGTDVVWEGAELVPVPIGSPNSLYKIPVTDCVLGGCAARIALFVPDRNGTEFAVLRWQGGTRKQQVEAADLAVSIADRWVRKGHIKYATVCQVLKAVLPSCFATVPSLKGKDKAKWTWSSLGMEPYLQSLATESSESKSKLTTEEQYNFFCSQFAIVVWQLALIQLDHCASDIERCAHLQRCLPVKSQFCAPSDMLLFGKRLPCWKIISNLLEPTRQTEEEEQQGGGNISY